MKTEYKIALICVLSGIGVVLISNIIPAIVWSYAQYSISLNTFMKLYSLSVACALIVLLCIEGLIIVYWKTVEYNTKNGDCDED